MAVVQTERAGDIAVITLDRPPVHAMDMTLLSELILALQAFTESDAKAAVLTAEGRTFCAGVDLPLLLQGGPEYVREFLPLLSQAFAALFTVPKPVVAALNGHALAGGAILAAACDARLAAKGSARIGLTEVLVGVPLPSWALEIVRFALPPQIAQEALLTGRRYTVDDCVALAFVEQAVEPEELRGKALELAGQFAAIPEAAFSHTKRQLRRPTAERVERHGPDFDGLAETLWAAPETAEHVQSFLAATISAKK